MRKAPLLVVMVLLTPVITAADLSDYLERSTTAEFQGDQIVTCATPDGVRDAVLQIVGRDGSLVVTSPVGDGESLSAGYGSLAVAGPDGSVRATQVASATDGPGPDRYSIVETIPGVYLGRSAETVVVERDGEARARMTFDAETGALLRSIVFQAGQRVYCDARMVSFDPSAPGIVTSGAEPEVVHVLESTAEFDQRALPDEVEGFVRLDQYRYDDSSVLAYYSDGFFAFTLLHSRRPVRLETSEALTRVESGNGFYERIYGPGTSLYVWESRLGGLAMFGDLPPDLQDRVLAGLPEPDQPSIFIRWWRRIFG